MRGRKALVQGVVHPSTALRPNWFCHLQGYTIFLLGLGGAHLISTAPPPPHVCCNAPEPNRSLWVCLSFGPSGTRFAKPNRANDTQAVQTMKRIEAISLVFTHEGLVGIFRVLTLNLTVS